MNFKTTSTEIPCVLDKVIELLNTQYMLNGKATSNINHNSKAKPMTDCHLENRCHKEYGHEFSYAGRRGKLRARTK